MGGGGEIEAANFKYFAQWDVPSFALRSELCRGSVDRFDNVSHDAIQQK